ncbi:uncharacterized protein BO95DRAFT_62912 [Aspergillus brunneoviolaceus CBS 621.78]|uniref:Uncharacterized protein n=1 Tax=Aspergillus brunneoviolaceus CBS 621.78 TaxID=1450534 RepID=A0ACD1GG68_9EURO|nr:hypothetical protein BO95DRAFT_62912 [Aspergillus brunneoviolaceus CBS 621.78]RAH48314.1 hypothetical protein BO95DRAFT_62912 [Aspergillus brunneoviolaceus CBS 621.78]
MAGTTAYDPENKGPALLAVMWTLTSLATVLVCARLVIRTKIIRAFGLDDWLIASSMILGLCNVSLATVAVTQGLGKHAATIGPSAAERANLTIDLGWIFGILAFALPKLGVAALLHRILVPGVRMRCALWGLTGMVMAVAVGNILVLFTQCDPPRALWATVEGARCRSSRVIIGVATFNGALSAFTDLSLAIYPSVILWRLQMSLHKKLALCAALGLGAISACAAIIKTTHLDALGDVADSTYESCPLVLWTNAEANLVIIASCIPTLQPLLDFILGKRSSACRSYSLPRSYPTPVPSYGPGSARKGRHQLTEGSVTRADSQEEIWSGDEEVETVRPGRGRGRGRKWEIHRTDQIVVEFEMGGGRGR